ncbi:MAG: WYL domain-containing protein [Moraxellaceae bacterium]|nr:WYL domain-containing protein [Moraxellaceae bacterium]HQV42144.1 WYL domain-containing protein [Moraxellaceae bacterium]
MTNSARKRPDTARVVERMTDMMSLLPRAPVWMSTAQVHERLKVLGYEVDRRTVARDLKKLSLSFKFECQGAVDEEEDGGARKARSYAWRWPAKSKSIFSSGMTEIEALTLTMVRDHLNALLPPMVTEALATQFIRAEERLKKAPGMAGKGLRSWSRAVHVVQSTQPLLRPKVKHAVRDVIYAALATRTQFTGWYRGRIAAEANEMVFNPLGLVIRGQITYLVATVWDYEDVRLYPLHRFDRALKQDEASLEPTGFELESYLAAQNGLGFATGRGDISVRLRFRNSAGLHLLETPLSEDQQAVDCGDGMIEISATVPETGQLNWWLLGFGESVEVLEPAELRAAMKSAADKMAAQYQ